MLYSGHRGCFFERCLRASFAVSRHRIAKDMVRGNGTECRTTEKELLTRREAKTQETVRGPNLRLRSGQESGRDLTPRRALTNSTAAEDWARIRNRHTSLGIQVRSVPGYLAADRARRSNIN